MSVVGHNEILVTNLSAMASGEARDFASKTTMVAAGYDLIWYDENGAALAAQPTWDLSKSDTNGDHFLEAEVVLDAYAVKLTVPVADLASVSIWTGRGTVYGLDDLGGMIASSGGVTLSSTLTSNTATMYDGDSIDISVSITEAALTSIGAASLTACDTRRAYIKRDSQDSGDVPDVDFAALTVSITTDTSGTRVLRIVTTTFPAILAIPDAEKSLACTLQVRLGEGSRVVIAAEVKITILWTSPEGALP